jgi:hypothetical protein
MTGVGLIIGTALHIPNCTQTHPKLRRLVFGRRRATAYNARSPVISGFFNIVAMTGDGE